MVVSLVPSNQRLVGLTTGFIELECTVVSYFCQVEGFLCNSKELSNKSNHSMKYP